MKKLIGFLFAFSMLCNIAIAQPSNVNSLFQKYSGEEGFTSMTLNDAGPLLKGVEGDSKAKEALKTVKKVRILSFDSKKGKNIAKGKQLAQDAKNTMPTGFEELMSMRDGSNFIKMYTKIDGKSTSEFLMMVSDNDNEGMIIYLSGDFTLSQIREVGRVLQSNRQGKGK